MRPHERRRGHWTSSSTRHAAICSLVIIGCCVDRVADRSPGHTTAGSPHLKPPTAWRSPGALDVGRASQWYRRGPAGSDQALNGAAPAGTQPGPKSNRWFKRRPRAAHPADQHAHERAVLRRFDNLEPEDRQQLCCDLRQPREGAGLRWSRARSKWPPIFAYEEPAQE